MTENRQMKIVTEDDLQYYCPICKALETPACRRAHHTCRPEYFEKEYHHAVCMSCLNMVGDSEIILAHGLDDSLFSAYDVCFLCHDCWYEIHGPSLSLATGITSLNVSDMLNQLYPVLVCTKCKRRKGGLAGDIPSTFVCIECELRQQESLGNDNTK